jgi:putative hemolysin
MALDRYIESGVAIESRWLVLRVLGIATSVLLIGRQLPESLGAWVHVLAAMGALVAYGVPTEVFRVIVLRTAERAAPLLLRLLRPLEWLVAPIAAPMFWIGGLVARSVTPPPPTARVTETEVEIIVNEGEMNGSLAHDQSEMIRNVLDFGDATAGEVMVPRPQVTAFELATPAEEVLSRISETKHSRYPVYRETIDNMVGILHVKDFVAYAATRDLKELKLEELMRKPVAFVPETRSASSVLTEMRAGRHHMAMVVDEFGAVNGIVTLEDLVEQIVGDIRREHDVEEPPIVDLGDGRLVVDASIPLGDLGRYLGKELKDDGDFHSLNGLIIDQLGRVPRPGTALTAHGLDFVVREADERKVVKVEILRAPPPPESMVPGSSRSVTAA